MLVLITYDVNTTSEEGRSRLRKVAKTCVNYGQRVQNSVFECSVDAAKFKKIKTELLNHINVEEDSIRFYNLGNQYRNRIEHYGTKVAYDPCGLLFV